MGAASKSLSFDSISYASVLVATARCRESSQSRWYSSVKSAALVKSSGLSGSIANPLMFVMELMTSSVKSWSLKFLPVRPAYYCKCLACITLMLRLRAARSTVSMLSEDVLNGTFAGNNGFVKVQLGSHSINMAPMMELA
jgi:hypothetical protein